MAHRKGRSNTNNSRWLFLFSVEAFSDPLAWLFKPSLPPPLRASCGLIRGLRATVLFGVLGCLAGVIGGAMVAVMNPPENSTWSLMGLTFGLVVVIPASRWAGRQSSLRFACCGVLVQFPMSSLPYLSTDPVYECVSRVWVCVGMALIAVLVNRNVECRVVVLPIVCSLVAIGLVDDASIAELCCASGTPGVGVELPVNVREMCCRIVLGAFAQTLFGIGLSGVYWGSVGAKQTMDEM